MRVQICSNIQHEVGIVYDSELLSLMMIVVTLRKTSAGLDSGALELKALQVCLRISVVRGAESFSSNYLRNLFLKSKFSAEPHVFQEDYLQPDLCIPNHL